jgi:hypothetical protein
MTAHPNIFKGKFDSVLIDHTIKTFGGVEVKLRTIQHCCVWKYVVNCGPFIAVVPMIQEAEWTREAVLTQVSLLTATSRCPIRTTSASYCSHLQWSEIASHIYLYSFLFSLKLIVFNPCKIMLRCFLNHSSLNLDSPALNVMEGHEVILFL